MELLKEYFFLRMRNGDAAVTDAGTLSLSLALDLAISRKEDILLVFDELFKDDDKGIGGITVVIVGIFETEEDWDK